LEKLTLEKLDAIQKQTLVNLELRLGKRNPDATDKHHVLICQGTGCLSASADKIEDAFRAELEKHNLTESVHIARTGCFGICQAGPVVLVYPEGAFYSHIEVKAVEQITKEHLLDGAPVQKFLLPDAVCENGEIKPIKEVPFYNKQERISLRLCGLINPENITEYIAFDGYKALEKVLFDMTPEEIIEEVKTSELRGRGGARISNR